MVQFTLYNVLALFISIPCFCFISFHPSTINNVNAARFPANPQTRKPANPQTRKPANPQTRKPANPQTRKPANPQTRKPANPQTRTRDTPSRLALLAQFFFLSKLNKHYFYNQVTSVFIPWLGTRPGYKFPCYFLLTNFSG